MKTDEKTQYIDRWTRVGEALFFSPGEGMEGYDERREAVAALGPAFWAQRRMAQGIDRDFNLLAHRWFHTIGSPTLNLLHALLSQSPGTIEALSFRLAEDAFHLGYLAGTYGNRLPDGINLVDSDIAAICLDRGYAGVSTIEDLQKEGLVPEFPDDVIDYLLKIKEGFAALTANQELLNAPDEDLNAPEEGP